MCARYLWRQKEDTELLGARVTNGCDLPDLGAEIQTGSFVRAPSVLNCWAISPAPLSFLR